MFRKSGFQNPGLADPSNIKKCFVMLCEFGCHPNKSAPNSRRGKVISMLITTVPLFLQCTEELHMYLNFFNVLILERERERLICSTYLFIHYCLMYVSWPGVEPTTFTYWDDALPVELPGQGWLPVHFQEQITDSGRKQMFKSPVCPRGPKIENITKKYHRLKLLPVQWWKMSLFPTSPLFFFLCQLGLHRA